MSQKSDLKIAPEETPCMAILQTKPLSFVKPDPNQPRKHFTEAELDRLGAEMLAPTRKLRWLSMQARNETLAARPQGGGAGRLRRTPRKHEARMDRHKNRAVRES